ncbi:SET domain [Trinorchestia longiramus]|nr:SET domain [Trinorchestia longiramus]
MSEKDSKNCCDVCRKPAKQFCSSCKAVFYCSRECQKRGWKEHKTKCKCFSIQIHPGFGRHLVATRDIKAGEVVLKEGPLLVGPKQKSPGICLGCHRPAKDYRCSNCHFPLCGPSCQRTKYHKDECEILSRANVSISLEEGTKLVPALSSIMALRVLMTRKKEPRTWEIINTMQDHVSDIKGGELYQYFETNVVDFLKKKAHYDEAEENTILKVCGILTTNAFEVKHNGSKVRGLYSSASKMAHSCTANTKHVFEEDLTIVVIATVPITKGTSITTNYSQVLWNTMARRQHLKMLKFFLCTCPRCSDATELGTQFSTLLCDECGSTILSREPLNLDAPWVCSKCSHSLTPKQVRWGDAVLYRELREMDKISPKSLENFLEKYKKALHSQNRFFVEAKYALIKLYGNSPNCRYRDMSRTQLENKVNWCRGLLDLSAVLDPGMSLLRGSLLFELQAGIVALAKHLLSNDIITTDGAKDYMKEAGEVLQEATTILNHEPDMRDGGLNDRLSKLAEELEI